MVTFICGALWIFAAWSACALGVLAFVRVTERPIFLLPILLAAAGATYGACWLDLRRPEGEGAVADLASIAVAFPLLFDAVFALAAAMWSAHGLGRMASWGARMLKK